MNDIITTMFNKKFMEELFKPQDLYSKKALRTVYDRLAHASIMRLNQASMDKVKHAAGPGLTSLGVAPPPSSFQSPSLVRGFTSLELGGFL